MRLGKWIILDPKYDHQKPLIFTITNKAQESTKQGLLAHSHYAQGYNTALVYCIPVPISFKDEFLAFYLLLLTMPEALHLSARL